MSFPRPLYALRILTSVPTMLIGFCLHYCGPDSLQNCLLWPLHVYTIAITRVLSGDFILGGGGGGNMVDKDSQKGHNTLLCTVRAFATSQLLTPIHHTYLECY